MVFISSVLISSLATFAFASPVARAPANEPLVLHESRASPARGFSEVSAANASQMLNMRIALIQNDIGGLEEKLYDVSTPSSANYGKYLSKSDVESYVRPSDETTSLVTSWLAANNISFKTVSPAGDWIGFSIPVSQASELFGANYSTFKHEQSGLETVRALNYSIPQDLQGHVAAVHPTISFPNPYFSLPAIKVPSGKKRAATNSSASVPSSCASSVTPTCLQDLYGIPTAAATEDSNVLGVSGFIEQYANQDDLKSFLDQYRTDISDSTTFILKTLDGGSNPQDGSDAGTEANLDTQYTVGIATGVPTWFISVGEQNNDDVDGFLDIINYLLDLDTPPYVLTTSYGFNEDDLSRSIAESVCNAYMQLGAKGTSILFSSGDGGVSGSQSQSCTDFVPTFPAGCPYITSIGASTGISPETAADFSSGGFSNYFDIPSYQSDVVSSYLDSIGDTYSGKYNASGRAFPDVSAQGYYVEIVVDGDTQQVAGTSCSSPIFASVISLLNDELVAAGKSPLGFLNPWLYENSDALNDVTSGTNPGCNTDGFSAAEGWDPVTGLGTPNYSALRTAAGL